MMNTDENMPTKGTGKNGKLESRTKKSAKRSRKPAQQEPAQQAAPEPEQDEQVQEPVTVATVAMENAFTDTAPDAPAATAPAEQEEAAPAAPVETAPVNLQTITNAYGDFTRKSIEQTSSFFEQLAGVRSLNGAFELQGAFARQTYETFVAQSRKIRELHSELTMQRWRHLEGLVARMKPTRSS